MSTAGNRHFMKPELWGGIECTINRVGDTYRDQLQLSGHYHRPSDISRFISLGIRAIRYPVLWERHEQSKGQQIDWSWTQRRLEEFHTSGITVIAGLLHHGSGPRFTNLLDPDFPSHLQSYASTVSKKFPWITDYTPVNEPLTTARFSGLYGFWYPHHKSDAHFVRMFMNQMKGIVLAMEAIRKINPAARLIQTEDLGKTHSTPLLSYQANFENERRWLTYDLLCGKVTRDHAMWDYLISNGMDEESLYFFVEHPCAPDVAGMNYYVTSERFLDERVALHSATSIGGNGRHTYADVEAVRVIPFDGLGALLREAWQRYRLPLAVTEVHLSCTREEQLRWLHEAWTTCCRARAENIDVRAITAWSLLGAFDWNSLLTREDTHYESGIFDIRSNIVRPTALATQVASLAAHGDYQHPLLAQKGWWHADATTETELICERAEDAPSLIIRGAGNITAVLEQQCIQRNIPYLVTEKRESDNVSEDAIKSIIDNYGPWGIIEVSEDPYPEPDGASPCLLARLSLYYNVSYMSISSHQTAPGELNHLVSMSMDLFIDRLSGIWNISENGAFLSTNFSPLQEQKEWQHPNKGAVNS